MAEVTFTEDTLRYASLFQDVTRTTVMDCLDTTDRMVFVVRPGQIGRAIGKKGENVAKLRRLMGRDILVVEFSEVPETFIANVFRNYEVKKVEIEQRGDMKHATVTVSATLKGKAIGRGGRNLRIARDLISRHFPIESVSVA
ncbi:MAG TPA: NusA-like transcription termination signal-binding factor [Thermoplasmata archaeon]